MPQANSAHSSAGMMLNASSANARAEPVNTGITAPVSVLGVLLESYTTKIAKGFVIFALLFG